MFVYSVRRSGGQHSIEQECVPLSAISLHDHARLTNDGIEIAAGPTLDDDRLGIAIFTA